MSHTLGGSGSTEAALTIGMMREGWIAENYNLDVADENCAKLDYVKNECRDFAGEYAMTNTFAFGGINTSIIVKKI